MTAKQVIEMALAYAGIPNAEFARRMGWSPQLLNKRSNTGKFTVDEWDSMGAAVGATAGVRFVFPDGMEISSERKENA